jgi:hypothetical protein
MTVATDAPSTLSFRQMLTSNEILSREALFKRKDTEAIGVQNWLFRLLGTVNPLVLAVGVLSALSSQWQSLAQSCQIGRQNSRLQPLSSALRSPHSQSLVQPLASSCGTATGWDRGERCDQKQS